VKLVNRTGEMQQTRVHVLLGWQLAAAVSHFTVKVRFPTATAGCSRWEGKSAQEVGVAWNPNRA
jgi:hypothetical protein